MRCPRSTAAVLAPLCAAALLLAAAPAPEYRGTRRALPAEMLAQMRQHSWRPGCPVPLADLVLLELNHWGYDGAVHDGVLVVHRDVADDLIAIFGDLFAARFPVEKMKPIDEYGGDDDASMADNNTSAFNCRWVTGRKGVFSRHSYGRAIDINPVANPYVKGRQVLPPAGKDYVDRSRPRLGMVRKGDAVHQAFRQRGWSWGGTWKRSQDYQHFEKRR